MHRYHSLVGVIQVRVKAIQWCECYACCDLSLPMIYRGTATWMTSKKKCLSLFCMYKMERGFQNFCEIILDYASESLKKLSTSCLQLNLRMPKLQAIFKTLVAIVSHDRQFCKMFSWLFCFVQVKALKRFSEKL